MKFRSLLTALFALVPILAFAAPPLKPIKLVGYGVHRVGAKNYAAPVVAQGYVIEDLRTLGMVGVGGSASVVITFLDEKGHTVNIGTAESKSLTVTTTAKSLPFILTATGDTIPVGAVGAVLRVATGSLAINRNGTSDGSTGVANGFAVATDVPSSASAEVLAAGQLFIVGLFSHAQYVTLASTATVLGTVTANQGTAGASAWPVSVATLPLPSGASTAANQTSVITLLGGGLPSVLSSDALKVREQGTVTITGTITANAGSGTLATSTADGANVTLGALSDAAAGDVNASVNAHLRQIAKLLNATLTVSGSGTFTISGAVTGSGNFASTVADGANVALGTTTDAAVGDATATANSHLRQIAKLLGGTLTVGGSGTFTISGAVTQSGTWTVQPGNTANTTAWKVDGSAVIQPVSGTVTASNTAGDVASGSSDSGNPVKAGARAINAEQTAVTNAQRVNVVADLTGRLIVALYCNPENIVNGVLSSDLTTTSSTQIVAAQAASVRTYIVTILVTNMHASVDTRVDILDGATVVWTGFAAHGGGGYAHTFGVPIRCTAATAVNVQCGTTGAQVRVSLQGYKGS